MKRAAIGAVGAGMGASAFRLPDPGRHPGTVPTRPLGKTGEEVSLLGVGGYHIATGDEAHGIRLVRQAIDAGVTFLDNAWEYHGGRAETIMGSALTEGYRDRAFLMTKHHGRDKDTAMKHLEDSLRRLRTDVIDLWQFHEVIYEKDPEMIFGPDGAIEAAEQARKEGKVRFIGFTGHKDPAIHLAMLSYDYPWDAVQMPLNILDASSERSFMRDVLPVLVEREIGVLAMKALAGGSLMRGTDVSPRDAHRFVYNLPISTLISGMDSPERMAFNIETVTQHAAMNEDEREQMLAATEPAARRGDFEPFKFTRAYDSRTGRELHGIQ